MALTGQLSDLSLAELIEFFCNQRKTGRLKVDYHRGHGVFFMKDGQLVDAKVGALSGAEAVYFALTLPNAAFDFSADFQPPRRTISVSWTQVVLEGLRRLDEGVSPSEAEAFSAEESSTVESASQASATGRSGRSAASEAAPEKDDKETAASDVPLSLLVDGASGGAGRSRMVMGVVIGCVLLACAVAAVPLAGRLSKSRASASVPTVVPVVASVQPEAAASSNASSSDTPSDAATEAANAEAARAADAVAADEAAATARREARERETRLREARERERRAEEAAKREGEGAEKPATPAAAAASGPKTVRVSVSYDEAGRVTQASVAGASPGGEAYTATAVRIARGRRFPAGKAGSTVVTIPFN